MKTSKKHKQMEDRIILLPRAEEDEVTDLSWMIRDDKILEKPVKKLSKRKKK